MYIWGYQTPVFIPNLYDWVKNFIFSEIFPFLGNKCTFGGTKLQFLSQSGKKNFIFNEFFSFLGNNCSFGGTKLSFYPHRVQKTFLVKFFHFSGTNVHLGVPNCSFYPHRVKKNFIFSEIFPFLRNKCIFPFLSPSGKNVRGTKLQFLSPIGSKKTSFLVKFFHFQGTNVHLGVPNSSFWGYQNLVNFSTFLWNKCTFGGTKLQFLSIIWQSPIGQKKNFIFSEIFPFLGNKCTFGGTKLQFLSPSGQKKT